MDSFGKDVFNGPAVIIGCTAMLVCLGVQGSTVVLVMTHFKNRVRALVSQQRALAAHAMFFGGILVLLMSHILQIYIWALFLYVPGIMENFHHAVVLSGSTYTTVGFADDTLPLYWQMLAVIMATTGLFAFAWSTSILFLLSQQVYRTED